MTANKDEERDAVWRMCLCPGTIELADYVQGYQLGQASVAKGVNFGFVASGEQLGSVVGLQKDTMKPPCLWDSIGQLLTEAITWSCEPTANPGRRFLEESPTREKLRRRMIGLTTSSTQSWERRNFEKPPSFSLPITGLLLCTPDSATSGLRGQAALPALLLSGLHILSLPISHSRDQGPDKLVLALFPIPQTLLPHFPKPPPHFPQTENPHWQKQLYRFTVITKPQSLSSCQSPALGLIKNSTRNQTAWIQGQIILHRALDIT